MQDFEKAAGIVPEERQLKWQKTEFTLFAISNEYVYW